jgi:hypothetical protein
VSDRVIECSSEAIHGWFELTYSNYLVIPRAVLQSMPDRWQEEFVALLDEAREAFGHLDHPASYGVFARDGETGRFYRDPVPHYNRGRTRLTPRPGYLARQP